MRRRIAWALALSALVVVPSAAGWSWPAQGRILQPFVFDEAHPYAAGQHRGIDIAAVPGSPVLAPVAGRVTFAGAVPSSGTTLSILSGAYSVTLTQLGSLSVTRGQPVSEGQALGTAGGAVHLGVRVASDPQGYVDPMLFLPPPMGDASAADDGAAPVTADASGASDATASSAVPVDGASVDPSAPGDAAAATDVSDPAGEAPGAASDAVDDGTADAASPAEAADAGPAATDVAVAAATDDHASAATDGDGAGSAVAGDASAAGASSAGDAAGPADAPPAVGVEPDAGDPAAAAADPSAVAGTDDAAPPTAPDIATPPLSDDSVGTTLDAEDGATEAAPDATVSPVPAAPAVPTDTLDPIPLDEPPAPLDSGTATDDPAPATAPKPAAGSVGDGDVDPTAAAPLLADPPVEATADPADATASAPVAPAPVASTPSEPEPSFAPVDATPPAPPVEVASADGAQRSAPAEPATSSPVEATPSELDVRAPRAGTLVAWPGDAQSATSAPTATAAGRRTPHVAPSGHPAAERGPTHVRVHQPLRLISPIPHRAAGAVAGAPLVAAVAGRIGERGAWSLTLRIVFVALLILGAMALVRLLRRTSARSARRLISGLDRERGGGREPRGERASTHEQPEAPGPCGTARARVGHVHPLPAGGRERRPHSQRPRRARDASDGHRSRSRVGG